MIDTNSSGALLHYRLNFLIYIVTCFFSLTQAIQGSIFFAGVTVLTCVLAGILGTILVRAVVEQDIRDMEEREAEERSEEDENSLYDNAPEAPMDKE